jgi:hypothetical protein
MNNFDDDEASTGGGYERSIVRPLVAEDGIARRIVTRFRGRPVERVPVALEEIREGQLGALMRYDVRRRARPIPSTRARMARTLRTHRSVRGSTASNRAPRSPLPRSEHDILTGKPNFLASTPWWSDK